MNKATLREEMKGRLSTLAWDPINVRLQEHLNLFLQNNILFPLGAFWPIDKIEPNIRLCLIQGLERKQSILLPRCIGNDMSFFEIGEELNLSISSLGFHEPISEKVVDPQIILVPLLAFDAKGYRLGKGKGFYDRFIKQMREKNSKAICMGIAAGIQKVETVYAEDHDQPLSGVITEFGLQWF